MAGGGETDRVDGKVSKDVGERRVAKGKYAKGTNSVEIHENTSLHEIIAFCYLHLAPYYTTPGCIYIPAT
jgi:hypothetical protein